MPRQKHIRGRDATHMAIENDKRRPIALDPAPDGLVKFCRGGPAPC